jgi:hypothetical protein
MLPGALILSSAWASSETEALKVEASTDAESWAAVVSAIELVKSASAETLSMACKASDKDERKSPRLKGVSTAAAVSEMDAALSWPVKPAIAAEDIAWRPNTLTFKRQSHLQTQAFV